MKSSSQMAIKIDNKPLRNKRQGFSCRKSITVAAVLLVSPFAVAPCDMRADEPNRSNSSVNDPTVPSPAIRDRLNKSSYRPPIEVPTDSHRPEPIQKLIPKEFKIKAMVFRDRDHGSVLLAVGNHRINLALQRGTENDGTPKEQSPVAFQVDGDLFTLVEFAPDSVTIRNHTSNTTMVIR